MATVPDDFNRANETPLAGNWQTGTSEGAFNLSSNSVTPASLAADSSSIYSGATFTQDQGAQVRVTTTGGGAGIGGGVALRHSLTARTYYRIIVGSGSNGAEVARFVTGTFTSLATIALTWTNGDLLAAEAVGPPGATRIQVFRNGAQIGNTVFDNSTVAAGVPGLAYSGAASTLTLDDWVGYELFPLFRPNKMPLGV